MKLYIWDDPYDVNYGSSLLIVAADSLSEARLMAKKAPHGVYSFKSKGVDVDKKKPSRVKNLPYAEYHEWSE